MYNLLIVTHGPLARALKETLKMFTSDVEDIHAVGLTESGVEEFKVKVIDAVDNFYKQGKGLLVLVDLFGGTPFNVAMLELKNKYENVEIITGVNLPLLIEASLLRGSSNLEDIIDTLRESAQGAIISPGENKSSEDDE